MSIEDEVWNGFSSPPTKRKRDQLDVPSEKSVRKIKRKRRKVTKEEDDVDVAHHINSPISKLDPQLLADLLAKQTKRFNPDLSLIELEEKRIPGTLNPTERELYPLTSFYLEN